MRSSPGPGALLSLLVLLSDFSPMSTSMPSSSGEEELGEGGVAVPVGVAMELSENLILRSIGESAAGEGGDTGL